MNGTPLALGAAGVLALLGATRRGSADRSMLGPMKPLVSGFKYRAKQSSDGLAVFLYKGSKRVGFLDAYWRYSISSIEDESRRATMDPKWHLSCYDDLRVLGAEGRHPKILAVYGTQLDEDVRGKGVGKALYEALMAEAFDENGPFFFVPMACWSSRSSTSASAMRVWSSLARAYPSSGVVVRVDRRPTPGSANRGGSRATSSPYAKSDVLALGYSEAEVKRALSGMEKTPSGAAAGPTDARRMDTDYAGLDFTPPRAVRDAAMKGLRLRKLREARGVRVDPKTGMGPGGMWIGVGRAIQLATADRVPPRDVRRMADYHRRHKVDKRGEGFGDEARPSNGYVAWLLWGSDVSDEAKRWSERLVAQMDAADAR